jgi:HlyD family secretion protein
MAHHIGQEAEGGAEGHGGYARLGFGAIGLVFGAFGVWSAAAPLDSAAVASARLSVEGDRKPVQHLEGGIVQEILASDAQVVRAGDVLFRFDVTRARAAAESTRQQIVSFRAVEARLRSETGEGPLLFPADIAAEPARPDVALVLSDQRRILTERARSVSIQTMALEARIRQAREEIASRSARAEATKRQIASLGEELAGVRGLADRGFFPRNRLRAMERDMARLEGERGSLAAETARLLASIDETRQQMLQIEQRQREEAGRELAETRAKLAEARERLAVAEDQVARVEVRAPVDGIVLGVRVKTPGAVLQPGAPLAEIVPVGARLVLSARISPLDVQAVTTGQRAEVRFPAFSSKSTPPLKGRVETLSADAVQDESTREAFYQARVVIEQDAIPADMAARLMPGMPADVIIATGERTVMGYLLGPLRDRLSKAMRER